MKLTTAYPISGISIAICLLLVTETKLPAAEPTSVTPPPQEFHDAMSRLAQWRDSLDSLQVTYTWNDPFHADNFLDERNGVVVLEIEPRRSTLKWIDWWVATGDQYQKTVTEVTLEGGKCYRIESGRNADLQYYAEFEQLAVFPRMMTVADVGTKKTMQLRELMPLFPIYHAINGWFSGAFERTPVTCLGIREIDGHRCVGVQMDPNLYPVMWLDLEYDGLPRLIETSSTVTRWYWKCDEFQRTNTNQWFPKSGTCGFEGRDSIRFHVESVSVNEAVSLADVAVPQIDQDTFFRDMTLHGAQRLIIAQNRSSTPERPEATPQLVNVRYASISGPNVPFSWWRVHCSVGMLATSWGWFRWRKQSDCQSDDDNVEQGQPRSTQAA